MGMCVHVKAVFVLTSPPMLKAKCHCPGLGVHKCLGCFNMQTLPCLPVIEPWYVWLSVLNVYLSILYIETVCVFVFCHTGRFQCIHFTFCICTTGEDSYVMVPGTICDAHSVCCWLLLVMWPLKFSKWVRNDDSLHLCIYICSVGQLWLANHIAYPWLLHVKDVAIGKDHLKRNIHTTLSCWEGDTPAYSTLTTTK